MEYGLRTHGIQRLTEAVNQHLGRLQLSPEIGHAIKAKKKSCEQMGWPSSVERVFQNEPTFLMKF